MKVIIAGSRGFDDYHKLCEICDDFLKSFSDISIVSGAALGADQLGERYAESKGYLIHKYPADWPTLGKKAAYARNLQMAQNSDVLIAFWDGKSKGTKMMIQLAKKNNLKVLVYNYNQIFQPSLFP